METIGNLRQDTVDRLQTLIRRNIDSQKGFEQAAETIKNGQLANLFREIAQIRRQHAADLQTHVVLSAEEPAQDGSTAGSLHRWWISARTAMTGGDDHTVLSEAERGEDAIKQAYEEVIKETAGSAVNDLLLRQYAEVKRTHDRIRDLRDALAPTNS